MVGGELNLNEPLVTTLRCSSVPERGEDIGNFENVWVSIFTFRAKPHPIKQLPICQERSNTLNQKDEKEFEVIFWEHKDMVYFTALRYFKDPSQAEDIVQEVFLKVYLNLHKFLQKSTLKTWIYRIALNEIFGRFRKEKKHRYSLPLDESLKAKTSEKWDTSEIKEFQEQLYKELKKLPKKRAKVTLLRLFENLSFRDIGETLAISENSAKSLFALAIKTLKKKLEAHHAN